MLFFPKEDRRDAENVVVIPRYRGTRFYVRQKDRKSFAYPETNIAAGEAPADAARRVLRETCGRADFRLWPVTGYGLLQGKQAVYGQLFFAAVERLDDPPPAAAAIFPLSVSAEEPEESAGGTLQAQLLEKTEKWLVDNRTLLYCVRDMGLARARLLKAMDGRYIDSVYRFREGPPGEALPALAHARGLRVTDAGKGEAGGVEALFIERGMAVFGQLLDGEKGRCAVLGISDALLAELLGECEAFFRSGENARFDKYNFDEDGGRHGADRGGAAQEKKALCLELLGEHVIGADWMTGI